MLKAECDLQLATEDAEKLDAHFMNRAQRNAKDYDAVMARLAVLKVKGIPVWKLDSALREIFTRYYRLDEKA